MKRLSSLKNFAKQLLNRSFLIFLLLSAVMWYLNKLSHTYSSNIVIPVNIVNDFNSKQMLIEKTNMVTCQIESEGHRLLSRKLFSKHRKITIPSNELIFIDVADAPFTMKIENESLADALNSRLSPIKLVSIKTGNIYVTSSETVTRKLPVFSTVEIDTKQNFRIISDVDISPDSIIVKGVKPIVDTMTGIWTKKRVFNRVDRSLSGVLELEKIEGVTYSTNEVNFNVDIDTYTEMVFESVIRIKNCPDSLKATILPETAKIKLNVNRGNFNFIKPDHIWLTIDYKDFHTNISNKFKVNCNSLPQGIKIMSIQPSYVDVIFEKANRENIANNNQQNSKQ